MYMEKSLPDSERLEASDKVRILNGQRNELMNEINEYFQKAIKGNIKTSQQIIKHYKGAK